MNNPPEDDHLLKRWFQRHLDPVLQDDAERFDRERWQRDTLPATEIRPLPPDRRWAAWAAAAAAGIAALPLLARPGLPSVGSPLASASSTMVHRSSPRLQIQIPAGMVPTAAGSPSNPSARFTPKTVTRMPVSASQFPRGATSVTITRVSPLSGWGPARLRTRWTRPQWIALATTDIRHALTFQDVYGSGLVNCPADNGVYYVLVFEYAHHGPYTAVTDVSGCGSLSLYAGALSATEALSLTGPSGPMYVPQQLGALLQSLMPKNMSPYAR